MDRRQVAIMAAQMKKATIEPNEFIKFAFKSESETNVWYIILSNFSGDDGEFSYQITNESGNVETKYGEYLVRVELPGNFPFDPPHFYFLTENGLYGVGTKVCISIGEFHKDQYRAALGVSGFCNQLVSGLIGWKSMGGGIAITKTTVKQKKELAAKSYDYNRSHYPEIIEKVETAYAIYSSKWDLSKIPHEMKVRLGLTSEEECLPGSV
ncbi:E2 ubiquitin-conjugating enzyme [Pacmanvirus S19]|nr:E2 ubiquitin-conjugating enzyme [Pacmanvirus S19]